MASFFCHSIFGFDDAGCLYRWSLSLSPSHPPHLRLLLFKMAGEDARRRQVGIQAEEILKSLLKIGLAKRVAGLIQMGEFCGTHQVWELVTVE